MASTSREQFGMKHSHYEPKSQRLPKTKNKKDLQIGDSAPKAKALTRKYSRRNNTLADTYNRRHYARRESSVKTNEPFVPHHFTKADNPKSRRDRGKSSLLGKCDAIKIFPKTNTAIDMSKVPRSLRNLRRTPNYQEPFLHAWTSTLRDTSRRGGGIGGSSGIILTDIALNQSPDLVLSTSTFGRDNVAKRSRFTLRKQPTKGTEERSLELDPSRETQRAKIVHASLWNRFTDNVFSRKSSTTLNIDACTSASMLLGKIPPRGSLSLKPRESKGSAVEAKVSIVDEFSVCKTWKPDHAEHSMSGSNDGIYTNWTILDLQKEKEKQELLPSRYVDDIKVRHNIHRREMVSKLLYREQGHLFYRHGPPEDPHPPLPKRYLLAGVTPLPPMTRNLILEPLVTEKDIKKVLKKVFCR